MTNVLLTGGTGFIGKNIVEQLGQMYELFAPTRAELDLLDEQAVQNFFRKHHIDVVIHTAALGVNYKRGGFSVVEGNVRMFNNIANQNERYKKMIFLGSGAEYDKSRDIVHVREEDFGRFVPSDDYGLAKYTCSQYIETFDKIVSLRCFGVYGKYENPQRFISSAILSALSGKPISIRQNVFFDYLYVDDLIKIIDYFIVNEPRHKFYNAVSGQRVDLATLAGIVEKISNATQGIAVGQIGLQKEYTADNSRLMKELKNFVFTNHANGIEQLYNFYK